MSAVDRHLKLAVEGTKESGLIDFKSEFNPHEHAACCEVIKDIVAMANSGGGVLAIGVNDDGTPSHADLTSLSQLDISNLTNKVHAFTGSNFADIEIHAVARGTKDIIAICVGPAESPLVFSKDGSYKAPLQGNMLKFAFRAGAVYFRHGAKSVPGTTEDLKDALQRGVTAARREMLKNVRLAASAKKDSIVQVVPRSFSGDPGSHGVAVRIVTDPKAPAVGYIDNEKRFPLRQKELVEMVLKTLPKNTTFTTHDVQAIRRMHGIDTEEVFSHFFGFGVRRYSKAFAAWIVRKWNDDNQFFSKTRAKYKSFQQKQGKGPWTAAMKKK